MDNKDKNYSNEELFSKAVRAGKRTYFFDVKSTRSGENYLTITESKKRFDQQTGKFFYEKHKLFLYQEDFDKFLTAINQSFEYIKTGEVPQSYIEEMEEEERRKKESEFTDVSFDDLGKKEDSESEE
ncbi:MAG: DUF3276 family protein [Bacteroidetes bacterium]|nr:MAG: DUF3276 family protein [Bacteroidota bacterium]